MFSLPEDIQRYIYEFCSFKWDALKKINSQFLKGGFNQSQLLCKFQNHPILYSNFVRNEKLYAKLASIYRNSRNANVTKWLRNIESYEEMFGENMDKKS
jgi:hypothetical protein